ncbi:histone deacetylase [Candidatus Poribacteria bacterium]|nr:histone deacetylase [Candidatus Poribacteria bacterium]
MAKTGIVYHDDYLLHDTGFGHPERRQRLEAIWEVLPSSSVGGKLVRIVARPALPDELAYIHSASHIADIRKISERGGGLLDYDTPIDSRSYEIALLSVGGVLSAVDAVLGGEVDSCFACVRPPGHHATPSRGMGFCLFNNVAIAARHAQRRHGIDRVLIVDWDVHHGNGTQDAFYSDGSVFFFSVHQHPLYPGTGMAQERGDGDGFGATLNAPLPARSGDEDYVAVFWSRLVPAAREFQPELILISAGFDAHEADPLGGMRVTTHGFGALTSIVRELADELCGGRIVSSLEGGYSLDGLSSSVVEHLARLSE